MTDLRFTSGRPAEGEVIDAPPYGECTVLEHTDPSIVRLRTAGGTEVKVGEQALAQMLNQAAEDAR